MSRVAISVLVVVVLLVGNLSGQVCSPEFSSELVPQAPAPAGGFGSVLVSYNDRVASGSPDVGTGVVELFTIVEGGATFDEAVTTPGLAPGDRFGASIALWGQRLAIGAPGTNGFAGAAYAGSAAGLPPTILTPLDPGPLSPGDEFGSSVFSFYLGRYVGAPGDDEMGTDAGAVYEFSQTGPTAPWLFVQKIFASEPAPGARFGQTLTESGLIGAPGQGRVYTFAGDFVEAPPGVTSFGSSAFIHGIPGSGGVGLVVGAPDANGGAGSVFAYWGSSLATLTLEATMDSPAAGAQFGHSVVGQYGVALIGAPGIDRAYIYRRDSAGQWSLTDEIIPASNGSFGQATAFEDGHVMVAAPTRDGVELEAGAIDVFDFDPFECNAFMRGDVNMDGGIDIGDPLLILAQLHWPGTPGPTCRDVGDVNDDGGFDISDAVGLLNYLFVDSTPLASLMTGTCEVDSTFDVNDCISFDGCP